MRICDLGFGGLGNGTTVWDRNVDRGCDYETVAHISDHGVVKFYDDKLPEEAITRINEMAAKVKKKFMESWNKKSAIDKYIYMMEIPTIGCGLNAMGIADRDHKNLPLEKRVPIIEKVFFSMHM